MRIVVLDGHTLNPGDLSWDGLAALGDLAVHPRSAPAEVVPRARGAAVVLTNKVLLDRPVIAALPDLRYIGVLATGYNVVDCDAARDHGVAVTNVPAYGTPSVAQFTFALLLELAHRVGAHAAAVRAGRWSSCPDFCFWDHPLIELAGLTMGLVGCGRIGRAVAAIAHAFGMPVIVHDPSFVAPPPGLRLVGLDDLFREADVVSLHCPLTADNRGLVDARRLALMKPSAFLLNTGRGPLVDETALAEALAAGRIAGAGLDVMVREPPDLTNPLLHAPNCVITPHIAWASCAARRRLMDTVIANLRDFLAGTPRNVVT